MKHNFTLQYIARNGTKSRQIRKGHIFIVRKGQIVIQDRVDENGASIPVIPSIICSTEVTDAFLSNPDNYTLDTKWCEAARHCLVQNVKAAKQELLDFESDFNSCQCL